MIFLDTSAIYALADTADGNHLGATKLLRAALESNERFLTHNYVLVESMALLQHRLGLQAALKLAADADAFEIDWITRPVHDEAVTWLRRSARRQVSLVDAMSFLVMRARRCDAAFAFDPHFAREGFRLWTTA